MELETYLSYKKQFQKYFLSYIEDEENTEENYQNLIKFIENQEFHKDIDELRLLLNFINFISLNHNRSNNLIAKIEKILMIFKNNIQTLFDSQEIYQIFKKNKRILLFLIENTFIKIDKFIANDISFKDYFSIELEPYFSDEEKIKYKIEPKDIKNYKEKRRIGQNENEIYNYIRKDLIDEFITYVIKNEISVNCTIQPSIFETNLNLNNKTLINYAAFFGSLQIFKYLHKNNADLSSIWTYAIHGNNPEFINYLEENNIIPENESYNDCLMEAIICHHNEMAEYIKEKYFKNINDINETIVSKSILYYNYEFIQICLLNNHHFIDLSKGNHYYIVQQMLKNKIIDINIDLCDEVNGGMASMKPWQIALYYKVNIFDILTNWDNIDINSNLNYFKSSGCFETHTILNYLIEYNIKEGIPYLLNHKNIDVNCRCIYHNNQYNEIFYFSPIHTAISLQSAEIVKLLLKHPNIDINCRFKIATYDKIFEGNALYAAFFF